MAAKTILALDTIISTDVAAGDLAALWDATAGFTKKIDANVLLDAILRVAGSTPILARNTNSLLLGTGGILGALTDQVQVTNTTTGNVAFLTIGRPAKGYGYWAFRQDGNSNPVFNFRGSIDEVRLQIREQSANNVTLALGSGAGLGWSSSSNVDSSSGTDSGLIRLAPKVVGFTDGGAIGPGWGQNTAGWSRVANNVTNATDTMANITGLSSTLIAGRKYSGELTLFCSTDQAAEGIKFDFDGGAATMTSFAAAITSNVQGATLGVTVSAALATDLTVTALSGTGVNCIVIKFGLVCNAAGTFIPRVSQVAHASGTATVVANSFMKLDDMP